MVDTALGTAPDTIRDELARVLASPNFDASERNRRFLAYVVDETLAGRADRIKAYAIATLVFHRDAGFDAQADPIVRIEAQRLRRALEHYYLTAGRRAAVRISIPKGAYVPRFEVAHHDPPARERACGRFGPAIGVLPFEVDASDGAAASWAQGLVRHLRVALARFGEIDVLALEHECGRTDDQVRLGGGITRNRAGLEVDVWLVDAASGHHLWAQAFDAVTEPGAHAAIADAVARALAQPYGVLFALRARQLDDSAPETWDADEAVVQAHMYRAGFAPERAPAVHAALARTSVHSEATACRALLLAEEHRLTRPARPEARDLALALARRAIELAPRSARSHHALAAALWAEGDVDAAFDAFETGLELNPNDTTLAADLGFHRALRAEWDAAVERLLASFAANPALPQRYRLGLALADYGCGRFEAALREAARVDAPAFAYAALVPAAAAARLGDHASAARALGTLLRADAAYGRRMARALIDDNVDADLRASLVTDLRRAGLVTTAGEPACRLVQGPAA